MHGQGRNNLMLLMFRKNISFYFNFFACLEISHWLTGIDIHTLLQIARRQQVSHLARAYAEQLRASQITTTRQDTNSNIVVSFVICIRTAV
jgi:hypothetical protein